MITGLPLAWTCLLGAGAGFASILIYRELSPQDRLRRLTSAIAVVRKQLSAYEGEFAGAWELTAENLRLSFERLGYALWPATGSSIPVLLGLPAVGESFLPYFLTAFVVALTAKIRLRIA
jgi:hypothetical protein